ncbi:hypothetical protein KDU71_07480 [Carboxylicivirga sediminis]|uniref:Uncharacterized protein n=1 Tax=Carboxylicivirga sediminis TaxID=2006564 RepID=A0A941F2Z7_9BACT|nr:hypothetical protein [Carboxylicivirga sediminis]MBR8535397.1 hypothetical protein [Carboxylicivirga sediminis]
MDFIPDIAINLAFIVGIIAQLVKVFDLLLKPQQKKIIESAVETLVLRLEYTKPIKWLEKLINKKFLLAIVIVVLLLITVLILEITRVFSGVAYSSSDLIFALFLIIVAGIPVFLYGYPLSKWLVKDVHPIKFFLKSIIILTVSLIVLLTSDYIGENMGSDWSTWLFIVTGLYPASLIFLISILITFTLMLLILVIKLLVIISRFICWRILDYNKGPVAAITLIITVGLGTWKLFLEH